MGLFGRSKRNLLKWQKLVMQNSPNRLVMSEKQLKQFTAQQVSNDLRILNDCAKLINNTIKPDIFFSRLQLLKQTCNHLIQFEPYVKFSGDSPSTTLKKVMANEQASIHNFIVRYFNATSNKAESLKTEKGKKNQFQKFYDSLQPYRKNLPPKSVEYIEEKYKKYIL